MIRTQSSGLASRRKLNEVIEAVNRFPPPRQLPLGDYTERDLVPILHATSIAVGRMQGKIAEGIAKSNIGAATALIESDVATFPAAFNCEIWDASDLGISLGKLWGHKDDGTPIFLETSTKAMRDMRYNLSTHVIEVTYKRNPGTNDWIPKVTFTTCTGGARSIGGILGGSSGGTSDELIGTLQPISFAGNFNGSDQGRI